MTSTDRKPSTSVLPLSFRIARPSDGAALWRLVRSTGTLEANSAYAYLLLATDFADTCLVAERDGALVGAVIGLHPPRHPDTAFVWQIGLRPDCQGQGLGLQLLLHWLALAANANCRWLTATVADDNPASQALFRRLAQVLGTQCEVRPHFTADQFPTPHAAEPLYRIGPIAQRHRCAAQPTATGAHDEHL
jgi:L-2,4-diaminobutyric acid acetyltransferase